MYGRLEQRLATNEARSDWLQFLSDVPRVHMTNSLPLRYIKLLLLSGEAMQTPSGVNTN